MQERTIGLLLQSFPYLSSHRILKVLTPDAGLLTFMALFAASKRAALTTPFLLAEWVYAKSKKEILTVTDASLLDPLSDLKKDFAYLSAAGRIAQDLLRTQLPGKPAQAPFELALACLRKVSYFPNPSILPILFRLRLLSLEGLLPLNIPVSPTEKPLLEQLLHCKSFAQLATLPRDELLFQKINNLFENSW
ncbi:MAG: DNA repair protein RecO [Verrucomicrobiota bacterium]|nr:DNA repair protein RecO [Verrucomicrobiota bacterium]